MASSLRIAFRPKMGNPFSRILVYLRVGLFLHLVSLGFILMSVPCWKSAIHQLSMGNTLQAAGLFFLLSFFLTNIVLSQLDGRSRYQNYKQVKDQLLEYGFRNLILMPVRKSSCQRSAAMEAARETGFLSETRGFFYQSGYRWYHIPPDFLFSKPHFLFSRYFWRTTFFTPTYHPKHF